MPRHRITALFATLLLLTAPLAPAAAAETPLAVDVDQDGLGGTTVTVSHNGTSVENATVTVDAPNATYAGEGAHETDANGTVQLPAPETDVAVDVAAADGNNTGSATVDLQAPALAVDLRQARRGLAEATVTYAITGEPVENATVNVSAVDENATYAGTGEYTADANGTVDMPAPEEDVTIDLVAEGGNLTGSTTVDLVAPSLDVAIEQSDDGNATATATVTYAITGDPVENATVNVTVVDENTSYTGVGEYATDANGTVALPAPEANVTVEAIVEGGNLTGSATAELIAVEDAPEEGGEVDSFGVRVSAFVHSLLDDRGDHRGIGRSVAAWVSENNPGNAPDHAGPPDDGRDSVSSDGASDIDDTGENASTNGEDGEDEEDPDGGDGDHGDGDDDGDGGPPARAGPDHDRGNGKAKGR